MKLANVWWREARRVAVKDGEVWRILPDTWLDAPATELSAILRAFSDPDRWRAWTDAVWAHRGTWPTAAPSELKWRPVVEEPSKILCIGRNYRAHAEETHDEIPTEPIIFDKLRESLAAAEEAVPLPPVAREVDYEAELVVVIGRPAYRVSEAEALSYVAGYTAGHDVSARDLQFKTGQWLIGKGLAKFGPVGPSLTTADEVGDPQDLRIQLRRNGTIVQDARTASMIFSCAYLIHYISQLWTLQPGDLIFTGTPEGVIMGRPPAERQWLAPGDVTEVVIEKLDVLRNPFVAAP